MFTKGLNKELISHLVNQQNICEIVQFDLKRGVGLEVFPCERKVRNVCNTFGVYYRLLPRHSTNHERVLAKVEVS